MIGMNSIIHLFAAGALVGLAWLIMEFKLRFEFLQNLITDRQGLRILVLAPDKFLEKCCQAFKVPWENAKSLHLNPSKIRPRPFTEILIEHRIKVVRLIAESSDNQNGRPTVEVVIEDLRDAVAKDRLMEKMRLTFGDALSTTLSVEKPQDKL